MVRQNLEGYMAVTAHYSVEVNKRLVLQTRLIAFRHVGGSHTGKHLAEEFLSILKQFRLCERVRLTLEPIFIQVRYSYVTLRSGGSRSTMLPLARR